MAAVADNHEIQFHFTEPRELKEKFVLLNADAWLAQQDTEKEALETPETAAEREQRWYQLDTVAGVALALREGHTRICVVGPTGTGKTYSSRLLFEDAEIRALLGVEGDRPLRVLYAAHMDRLLLQAQREFEGTPSVQLLRQSVYSKIPERYIQEGWDVVCIDEAHHEAMRTYQDQLEILGNTPIIGLTATPDRDDGRLIKFSAIVEPISRVQAVREGYLARSTVNTILDESGTDKTEILTDLLHKYASYMDQTMVFVMTHGEVSRIAAVLTEMGYNAVGLIDQSNAEVHEILEQFSAGDIQFIVNCSRIDEGIDVKGATDVVMGRRYGSRRQINQTIGRAARPDCPCNVWEMVDPLETQYTAKDIIEELERHYLIYFDHEAKDWVRLSYPD